VVLTKKWIFVIMNTGVNMEELIISALNDVRPQLQADGGDVEFVSFDKDSGVVKVKLTGHCGNCPMSRMTLKMGIESYVRERIPEVSSVESDVETPDWAFV
jgi:Fe-S cluster biogenesis protein NfuA